MDESNYSVYSKTWIVFRHGIVAKLTSAAEFSWLLRVWWVASILFRAKYSAAIKTAVKVSFTTIPWRTLTIQILLTILLF